MKLETGLELIGKGAFTKAYAVSADVVLLKSVDPVKECMGNGWFPECTLFPAVTRASTGYYYMKRYQRVTSLKSALDADQWELYKTLRVLAKEFGTAHFNAVCMRKGRTVTHYHTLYNLFDSCADLSEEVKTNLLEALDSLANYGDDMCFEISPRNVAVDNGKLVLRDCFFMQSTLCAVSPLV